MQQYQQQKKIKLTFFNFIKAKMAILSRRNYILKNFLVLNVAFVLLYAAVNCIGSLQSVVNQNASLGTTSQSVNFAVNLLTCLVIPQVFIELMGFKLALALGQFLNMTWIIVQIYPDWITFMPS